MTMTVTDRSHGYARYRLDGCRCYVCGYAVSEYERNRAKAKAAGAWQPYVDAAPVREHLLALSRAGIGYKRAADLAGVSRTAVANILNAKTGRARPSTRIRPAAAAALLAIQSEDAITRAADGANIDATGTRRRIAALAAIGWSLSAQARRIGWMVQNYAPLLGAERVTAETARLVAGLYDQLSMTPAPSGYAATRARNWAAVQGFLPPLAWDDDAIDRPELGAAAGVAKPGEDVDEGLVWLALNGFLAAAELARAERAVFLRHQAEATGEAV